LPPISTIGITSSSEDITALTEKTRSLMLEAIEDLGRKRSEAKRLAGKAAQQAIEHEGERQPLLAQEGQAESS
ncbi:hypothetical protein JCM21900_001676, partial [Sporobolomyces salmonicolor]